jgi:kynurenine formamidase
MCAPEVAEVVRRHAEKERMPRLDRRGLLLAGAGTALAATLPGQARAGRTAAGRVQDLTHVFREGFPVFTFDPPAREPLATFPTHGFYSQKWTFGEHSATHMDAPGHFIPGGRHSPQITLGELTMVPAAVVDISQRAASDPDTQLSVGDLRRYERRHGAIAEGAVVFMNSGWSAKAGDPLAFKGGDAFPNYHFPGFDPDATEWLLRNRAITGIGVDTLSLDYGQSTAFETHFLVLGADKYGLENVANLDRIPPAGAAVIVGLIPWEEGSGGPCRVIARW